jgi:hypothetical protein
MPAALAERTSGHAKGSAGMWGHVVSRVDCDHAVENIL